MTRLAKVGAVVCTIALLRTLIGVAHGLTHCPTFDECWEKEYLCERTPKRAWKPCRREVAACFRRMDACRGGWSL